MEWLKKRDQINKNRVSVCEFWVILSVSITWSMLVVALIIGDNGMCSGVWPRARPSNRCIHQFRGENLLLLQRGRFIIHMRWWRRRHSFLMQCCDLDGSLISVVLVLVSGLLLVSRFCCSFKRASLSVLWFAVLFLSLLCFCHLHLMNIVVTLSVFDFIVLIYRTYGP